MNAREIDSMAIGERVKGMLKVYTSTDLKISIAGENDSGSIIIFNGGEYRVIKKNMYASQ